MDLSQFSQIVSPEKLPIVGFATVTIVGLVNLVQKRFPAITGLWGALLGITIGVVAGSLRLYGLDIPLGLLAGLGSTGIYKLSQVQGQASRGY